LKKHERIFIAGHNGLVGSAIQNTLKKRGYTNIITATRHELDLTNQNDVAAFFQITKPDYVFLAAAKVGGILANSTYPADFIYINLQIQNNIIHQSWVNGVKKLLFLGSSCIYPRNSKQPIKEEYLLSGTLEPTNDAYAIAKIAGIKMCQSYNAQYGTNFISVMPSNIYGSRDNYDLENSHVLQALIRKFHEALPSNPVTLWGTGSPRREFLHSVDLAEACLFLMENYNDSQIINIGPGKDISIEKLSHMVQEIIGHKGEIRWDSTKPDGMRQKLLDTTLINRMGWYPKIKLEAGIRDVYTNLDTKIWNNHTVASLTEGE